jgi:hypothetical protein
VQRTTQIPRTALSLAILPPKTELTTTARSCKKVVTTCSPKHFDLMKDRGADLVYDYVGKSQSRNLAFRIDKSSATRKSASRSGQRPMAQYRKPSTQCPQTRQQQSVQKPLARQVAFTAIYWELNAQEPMCSRSSSWATRCPAKHTSLSAKTWKRNSKTLRLGGNSILSRKNYGRKRSERLIRSALNREDYLVLRMGCGRCVRGR